MAIGASRSVDAAFLRRRGLVAVALGAVATAVAAVVLGLGGAVRTSAEVGLDTPSAATAWLVPLLRLAMDAAASITVGALLAAAFFAAEEHDPGGRSRLGPAGRTWTRVAAWAALAWAGAAGANLLVTVADFLDLPVTAVPLAAYASFVKTVVLGQVLLGTAVGALTVAVVCRFVRAVIPSAAALVLAVAVALPRAFTGHAMTSTLHALATSTMVLHVVAALLWTGGLVALLLARGQPPPTLAAGVRRFSRLALWCFVLVAVTGVLQAALRLYRWQHLTSSYGIVVAAKLAALMLLACLGRYHRIRSMPKLAAGRPYVFARVAVVEALVMAAAVGLAAGLSRTPPPDADSMVSHLDKPVERILYWLPEPIALTVALAAVGWYLAGIHRLRRAGATWPAGRTAAWIAGWVVIVAGLTTQLAGLGTGMYGVVDAAQYLALVAVAPPLLVGAVPVTLARRALRPATDEQMRGPLEWIDELGTTRMAKAFADPSVAAPLHCAGLCAGYLSVSHALSISSHATHLTLAAAALAASVWYTALPSRRSQALSHGTALAMTLARAGMLLVIGVALANANRPRELEVITALATITTALTLWIGRRRRAQDGDPPTDRDARSPVPPRQTGPDGSAKPPP